LVLKHLGGREGISRIVNLILQPLAGVRAGFVFGLRAISILETLWGWAYGGLDAGGDEWSPRSSWFLAVLTRFSPRAFTRAQRTIQLAPGKSSHGDLRSRAFTHTASSS
jgi:hypothetical protein